MAIVQSINTVYMFEAAFKEAGRADNFSWTGLKSLFDYLDDSFNDEPYDLDVIALCCEYTEDTYQSIAENYSIDLSEAEDEEEAKQIVIDYLQDNTSYVGEGDDDNLVYAAF